MNALRAAAAIWAALERLNEELAEELRFPLRFGLGLHSGLAVVGAIALSGRSSVQFLGDTGNVASRLEAASKEFDCVMVVSEAVFIEAGIALPTSPASTVTIKGREMFDVPVILFRDQGEAAGYLVRLREMQT